MITKSVAFKMFRVTNVTRCQYGFVKSFCSPKRTFKLTTACNSNDSLDKKNPIRRTLEAMKNDIKSVKTKLVGSLSNSKSDDTIAGAAEFQTHCDVLIIGGGGIGSSVAYWLKEKARNGLNVVVVERDNTYANASTVLSVGGLRQQFSLPENIQMSLFGADFMRESNKYLGDVDLNFTPHGYLVLATEQSAESLRRNSKLQNELGARNELLSQERLKVKFPWMNTDGIVLGCHGLEKEGWFDPWALLMGFKKKARNLGANFVNGEVIDFQFRSDHDTIENYKRLDSAIIKSPDGELRTIKFAICVVAAGAYSGQVARLAHIGTGPGLLSIPLPVEPRKRYVYVFNTQGKNVPIFGTPMTIDPDGTYFRSDGISGNYLCGRSPNNDAEPETDNLNVDHDYFTTDVWPTLANRVPAFESAKVCSSWAGFYEFNVFDENGIIGPHPYHHNMYIATGFSGHGIQQVPAVGRAISELIIDGHFRTIDLTRLGFDRIIVDRPMFEVNIF